MEKNAFQALPEDDKDIVSTLHHILLAHWREAAAMAWRAYEAHGRGAVIIDFRPYDEPPDQLPFSGYARAQDIDPNTVELAELRDYVARYDPQQEALFILYTPLGDTIIDLIPAVEGRPPPPLAADQFEAGYQ